MKTPSSGLTKAATLLMIATTLAACGSSPVADAKGVCLAIGKELVGARGKARRDQQKIDATLERMIGASCITRAEAAGVQFK